MKFVSRKEYANLRAEITYLLQQDSRRVSENSELKRQIEGLERFNRDLTKAYLEPDYSIGDFLNLHSLRAVVHSIVQHLGCEIIPPDRSGYRIRVTPPAPKPLKESKK